MLEKDLIYDKRILARNISRGTVTEEQVAKHMGELADLKGRYTEIEISVREGEMPIEYVEPEE